MEEETSDTSSNSKRLEELLDQLGARYDQSLPGLLDKAAIAPSVSTSEPPPLPGSWLHDLKVSVQEPMQADADVMPTTQSQSLGTASDKGSDIDIQAGSSASHPHSNPQISDASWIANATSQASIQNEPAPSAKAKITKKLDEKILMPPVNVPTSPMPWAVTSPQPIPTGIRIPPDPPRKRSGVGKSRYSIQIIICILLAVAGISWLLQQVNIMPVLPASQSGLTNVATSTPGIQETPLQTPTIAHQPTKTPTAAKPTPTAKPTQPSVVPTIPPTSVAPPPLTSTGIISFEDGGLNGWAHSDPDGTLLAVKNLSVSNAKDGSHILMVSYDSDNDESYPTLESSQLPKTLKAGQRITAYILKTQGSDVRASLYIADQSDTWYKAMSDRDVAFVNNNYTWYSFSFTVPANIQGPATKVGVILFGYKAVVYIDAISWH